MKNSSECGVNAFRMPVLKKMLLLKKIAKKCMHAAKQNGTRGKFSFFLKPDVHIKGNQKYNFNLKITNKTIIFFIKFPHSLLSRIAEILFS